MGLLFTGLLILSMVLLSGCAFLPLPFQIASSGKTLYDTARIIENKKTINDELASMMYEQNCKTRNIFEGRAYCIDLPILQAENLDY